MNAAALSLEAVATMAVEARKLSAEAENLNTRYRTHSARIRELSNQLKEATDGFIHMGNDLKSLSAAKTSTPKLTVVTNSAAKDVESETTFARAA